MKKAALRVLTKTGKSYRWEFTECEPDTNDYGNGIYISIKHPSGDHTLLDCRYTRGYNFDKMCVDFLIEYYGENLDELSEDD